MKSRYTNQQTAPDNAPEIGYVLKAFGRTSETFITNEIHLLYQKAGIPATARRRQPRQIAGHFFAGSGAGQRGGLSEMALPDAAALRARSSEALQPATAELSDDVI